MDASRAKALQRVSSFVPLIELNVNFGTTLMTFRQGVLESGSKDQMFELMVCRQFEGFLHRLNLVFGKSIRKMER